MKKDISLWQYAGFVFTVVLGTLLHFLYDLTGGSVLAAPFSAVNSGSSVFAQQNAAIQYGDLPYTLGSI